jgi:hypothetical protein
MDVHPTKNVSIGIDPYPYIKCVLQNLMTLKCIHHITSPKSDIAFSYDLRSLLTGSGGDQSPQRKLVPMRTETSDGWGEAADDLGHFVVIEL